MDSMNELMRRLNRISLDESNDSETITVTSLKKEIPTSAYTLLSCVHGRDRREQRQIGKRDLQAAVKYGVKERGFPHRVTREPRWKYTYKNVVYITDETSRVEVTSWVNPIEILEAYVTMQDVETHDRLSRKLRQRPDILTSHTVFIVDQSGSMKTHDVENFKTRSDAVFGTIALDYVGKQIDQKSIGHTDCASLILMRDNAELVFEREAIDNVLFNKILRQKESQPRGHGKYLPSLKMAAQLLEKDKDNPNCAVLVLFLSDGRPSDCNLNAFRPPVDFLKDVELIMTKMTEALGDRLTFGSIGFNRNSTQFYILQLMCTMIKEKGSNSMFQHSKGDAETLSIAVSTLTRSIVQSRTQLTALAENTSKTQRNIQQAKFNIPVNDYPVSGDWRIYCGGNPNFLEVWHCNSGKWYISSVVDGSTGIAIRKTYFGEGVERIVYHLRRLGRDRNGRMVFLPGEYVAKEPKYVEDERVKYHFHTTFYTTQMKAQRIADAFNTIIARTKKLHPYIHLAKITFLDCWVYTFYPEPHNQMGVLCEKYIDHRKYTKWNSNNGFVDAIGGLALNNKLGAVGNAKMSLNAILEDSSSEEDESDDGEINPICSVKKYPVKVADYPQCFSHFSYRHTNRKMLVCDLQGVLDSSQDPPVYELTDPVIHYYSPRNEGGPDIYKKRKFGRTDLSQSGINKFFETHQCNNLCALLGLPRI